MEPPTSRDEVARTDGLARSLTRIVPALEEFLTFRGPDPVRSRERWRARLSEPLPERGAGADATLDALSELVIDNGLRLGAPGFCGWISTMPTVVPALANLASSMAAAQRWWLGPGNILEVQALRWIRELIGLPRSFAGSFVSGGALANLLCLAAARQRAGERRGVDPALDGVAGLGAVRVYAGEAVHNVVMRALGVLGLGRRSLVCVPAHRHTGALDLARLRALLEGDVAAGRVPMAVVASAGDAHTGRIDPIDEMRALAHEFDAWLHVDAAYYGGFAVLDERVRPLFGDLPAVDSLAIDPHKWLAVPVGCGAGLVRDRKLLERALALGPAHYTNVSRSPDEAPRSSFDFFGMGHPAHSLEHSAPARGVAVWAALKEMGVAGVRARVSRHLDCARRVAERVRQHPALELLADPVLSIVCFRYHPSGVRDESVLETMNRTILAEIRARGRCIPSSTRIRNQLAIRACFIGPRTGLVDADALVDEVLAAARYLYEAAAADDDNDDNDDADARPSRGTP